MRLNAAARTPVSSPRAMQVRNWSDGSPWQLQGFSLQTTGSAAESRSGSFGGTAHGSRIQSAHEERSHIDPRSIRNFPGYE